jgi:hypothetical protein
MKGLKKSDLDELSQQIPTRDVIAQRQGMRTTFARIEAVEEAMFPWLKKRRAAARKEQDA